jgi:hypothetical protein
MAFFTAGWYNDNLRVLKLRLILYDCLLNPLTLLTLKHKGAIELEGEYYDSVSWVC